MSEGHEASSVLRAPRRRLSSKRDPAHPACGLSMGSRHPQALSIGPSRADGGHRRRRAVPALGGDGVPVLPMRRRPTIQEPLPVLWIAGCGARPWAGGPARAGGGRPRGSGGRGPRCLLLPLAPQRPVPERCHRPGSGSGRLRRGSGRPAPVRLRTGGTETCRGAAGRPGQRRGRDGRTAGWPCPWGVGGARLRPPVTCRAVARLARSGAAARGQWSFSLFGWA